MEEENTDSALLTIDTKNDLKAEIFIINCILPIDYSNLNNGYLAENFKSIKIKNNFLSYCKSKIIKISKYFFEKI